MTEQQGRIWRANREALAAGICAGLAQDLDLPPTLVRIVCAIFLILPTGLAYLALALLMRQRPQAMYRGFAGSYSRMRANPEAPGAAAAQAPLGAKWAMLRQRLELLEPRIAAAESCVTSREFDLDRKFRHMEG
jgi:phage shock protein C